LVNDAVACYDEIEQSAFSISNELYILGHSESTIIAAQVSGHRPATAGIILLNPFVQDMESTLIELARHIESANKQLKGIKEAVLRNFKKNFLEIRLRLKGN